MYMSKSKYGSIPGACSPAVLIQLADPNFYDFLRFNCLLGRFKTARGEEMTILLPDTKRVAFLKGIKDERQLLHEIDSLIIPQKFPSLGSFTEGFVNKAGIKGFFKKRMQN